MPIPNKEEGLEKDLRKSRLLRFCHIGRFFWGQLCLAVAAATEVQKKIAAKKRVSSVFECSPASVIKFTL
jgi:hypothetical protein